MAIHHMADASSIKALATVAVVLVTTTTILSTAGNSWQRGRTAKSEAPQSDLSDTGFNDGGVGDGSPTLPQTQALGDAAGVGPATVPRVVTRPTTVNVEPFTRQDSPDAIPRLIDRYIGHVDRPSRLVGRVERLVNGDESLRSEAPLLHDGTVFASPVEGDANMMEVRVPLSEPLEDTGDLMLDIERSPGQRHAMIISPSDASSSTELRFTVHRRHLPRPHMQIRVFGMNSQMPLLAKGDVEIE